MSENAKVPEIDVWMTKDERAIIHRAASILGVSVEEWARLVLVNKAYEIISVDISRKVDRSKLN